MDLWCPWINHSYSYISLNDRHIVWNFIRNIYILSIGWYSETGYSEHAYNELTLTAQWFLFTKAKLHVLNVTDINNYVYNKVNSNVTAVSFKRVLLHIVSTELLKFIFVHSFWLQSTLSQQSTKHVPKGVLEILLTLGTMDFVIWRQLFCYTQKEGRNYQNYRRAYHYL